MPEIHLPTKGTQDEILSAIRSIEKVDNYTPFIGRNVVDKHESYLALEITGKGILERIEYNNTVNETFNLSIQVDNGVIYKLTITGTTATPRRSDYNFFIPFNTKIKICINNSFSAGILDFVYLLK